MVSGEDNVSIAYAMMVLVSGISVVQAIWYTIQTARGKNHSWRPALVIGAEAFQYMVRLAVSLTDSNISSGLTVMNSRGLEVDIGTYLGWFFTCPLLVDAIGNVEDDIIYSVELYRAAMTNTEAVYSPRRVWWMSAVMSGMLCTVVVASLAEKTTQIAAVFCVGGALCMVLFAGIGRAIRRCLDHGADRLTAYSLLIVFYTGWSLFPLIWVLSPLGYDVLDAVTARALFGFADLIAKNLLSVLLTRLTVMSVNAKQAVLELKIQTSSHSDKAVDPSGLPPAATQPVPVALESPRPAAPDLSKIISDGAGTPTSQPALSLGTMMRIEMLQRELDELRQSASPSSPAGSQTRAFNLASLDRLKRSTDASPLYPTTSLASSSHRPTVRDIHTTSYNDQDPDPVTVSSTYGSGMEGGYDENDDDDVVLQLDSVVNDWAR
eukprot:TRINITY_DN425_c0_g1_i1.p1 TRINITY_DN425_c0_g1~~TRINITY_DN425_c0_g1_i1.p1  ORF type:complete len:435 (+),score=49.14 TRINITY_DN425_c0_g1_i1:234-1538(+)